MTEDERHVRAMADLAQREIEIYEKWGASVFFTPVFAHEMKLLALDRKKEMRRHQERKRQIISANPAPGFKYHHC